ncbi:MAG TPA: FHA domain-containing protein [Casimicrobiaceae bacterium]
MAIKGWVINRVNRLFTRVDLPPRATPFGEAVMRRTRDQRTPNIRGGGKHDALSGSQQHLGAYAPLVAAMRQELEHFVASHVRMHLAIAEKDRYLLTSIAVDCAGDDQARDLFQRFVREFKPEQIKQYLAKEVIGRLPNASAIDLAHFAGLNVAKDDADAAADEAYGELLAELRRGEPRAGAQPYQVSLKGRWSEQGMGVAPIEKAPGLPIPRTPLAGRTLEVEIDDANGSRHVTLPSIAPGRRYVVGSGESSDIVVNGEYASRRHCEVWFDQGAWWVTDGGSTNGIRVESANKVLGRSGAQTSRSGQAAIEVVAGARIVLSAVARGDPAHYPQLAIRSRSEVAAPATPIAPAVHAPMTPSTPIVVARRRGSGMMVTVQMASGERTIELPVAPLPFGIGRSRSQAFVIDWAHEDVSGHHVDIEKIDESGADVIVHGDNGVKIAGIAHATGARFRWRVGEPMILGSASGKESECTLLLSRRG